MIPPRTSIPKFGSRTLLATTTKPGSNISSPGHVAAGSAEARPGAPGAAHGEVHAAGRRRMILVSFWFLSWLFPFRFLELWQLAYFLRFFSKTMFSGSFRRRALIANKTFSMHGGPSPRQGVERDSVMNFISGSLFWTSEPFRVGR